MPPQSQDSTPSPSFPSDLECSANPHEEGFVGTLRRFIEVERKNLPVIFWALIVGILAGLVGGIFRLSLEKIDHWRRALMVWVSHDGILNWLVPVLFSALMVYVALLLVRRFAPETGGSGIQEMEGALDGLRPVRWKRVLPVKFIAGLFSLGGGLVLGREGPTVQMGGSLGKMISDIFCRTKEGAHTLIAAGAGAGLAAAFNAPLAGILFVFEEMRPQFHYSFLSVQAVIIACAASDFWVRVLTSPGPIIKMTVFSQPELWSLWIFIIFGALFGVFGFLFNRFLFRMLNFFSRWQGGWFHLKGILVGGLIGILIWLYPGLTGGGYVVIPEAFRTQFVPMTLLFLFLGRFGATIFSYGSGAPGGIFAPMLALGTLFGLWFGHMVEGVVPGQSFAPGVFAIAGMGALFSATVRAPLTGIILTVEMTGNYSLILPLIITCLSATLVAQGLGGRPVYTLLLERTLALAKKGSQILKGNPATQT